MQTTTTPRPPMFDFDKLQAIADALGSDWQATIYQNPYWWDNASEFRLTYVGTDLVLHGAYLHVRLCEGKLRCSGHTTLQEFHPHNHLSRYNANGKTELERFRASINVSPSKSPYQIAREIERRLFPDFLTLYRQAYQAYQAACGARTVANGIAERLANAIPGSRITLAKKVHDEAAIQNHGRLPGWRIQGKHVRTQYMDRLSMTETQALELIVLLQSWQEEA